MAKSYEELTFAEKAVYHVQRAEFYQNQAEVLEGRAGDRSGSDQMTAYLLNQDENLAFPYRQATGNRNGHQQRAIMYSLVALLEKMNK